MTEPLSGHNFKFAQLPKPDQKFESNEAEALGWGITETGGQFEKVECSNIENTFMLWSL